MLNNSTRVSIYNLSKFSYSINSYYNALTLISI